jgi:hypothetical protein
MGDNEMTRREDLRAIAMEVLEEAGAIRECGDDPGYYKKRDDADANTLAYAIGTNKVKNGEVDGTRKEFMAIIQSTLESVGGTCTACDNRQRKLDKE